MFEFRKYNNFKKIFCVFFSGHGKGYIHIDWEKLGYDVLILWTGDHKNEFKRRMYYTEGIEGFSCNEKETAYNIVNMANEYDEIAIIGSSMGAYGALSCYNLIDTTNKNIIVLNPKVNITYNTLSRYDHIPLRQNLGGNYKIGARWCIYGTRKNDIKQVGFLKGFHKMQYNCLEHNILPLLKSKGLLNRILSCFLYNIRRNTIINDLQNHLEFIKYENS